MTFELDRAIQSLQMVPISRMDVLSF